MVECFKICLHQLENSNSLFNIKEGKSIYQIKCLKPYFRLNPTTIVADPFLFVNKDTLYLFYESKQWLSPGVLKMVCTKDLKNWSSPVVVLEEPYHLSFPWVFEEDGHIYMLPETGATNTIRLYEARNEDLTNFIFVKELLYAPLDAQILMGYGDSCINKIGDKYFLFTQLQYTDRINTLELFVSDSLMGEYKAHPMSPIQHNQKLGRNAGSLMRFEGKLLRFSQDCTNLYGDNVSISQIEKITPTEYKEKLVLDNIIPTDIPFYKDGGHQFNAVMFKGKWIVATDAKEYHKLTLQRIYNRIKRIFS